MARKSKKFRFTRKVSLISAAAIIVIVAAGLGIWHYHDRPSQVVIGVAPAKNTTPANTQASDNSSSTSSDKQTSLAGGYGTSGGKGSGNTGSSGPGPLTPTGDFISNHFPGRNNSPTIETSVCNTTPGATCYIEFTQGNDTLKLQAGTADSNGSVYWNNWNISNYGFNSGNWTITAVATLNGQTAIAQDATSLTVQ